MSLLPNEPVARFLAEHKLSAQSPEFTNVFSLLQSTPEYEDSLGTSLLKEASEILSILDCDQLDAPTRENLEDLYANPPAFGPGGRLQFRNGEMRFDSKGRLGYFAFIPRGYTDYDSWRWLRFRVRHKCCYEV